MRLQLIFDVRAPISNEAMGSLFSVAYHVGATIGSTDYICLHPCLLCDPAGVLQTWREVGYCYHHSKTLLSVCRFIFYEFLWGIAAYQQVTG